MTTYQGLPGPHICDFWSREGSAAHYDDGSSFQIGRIDMVANTGTYVDSPFHRYAKGEDLAELPLESLADLAGIVVRRPYEKGWRSTSSFPGLDVRGKAVLVHTGWDRHWRTAAYVEEHPFLTAEAADWLVGQRRGARRHRQQQHRRHARAGPAGAHRVARRRHSDRRASDGLGSLPDSGFRFSAVPPKVQGHGDLSGARLRRTRLSERVSSQSGMIASAGMVDPRDEQPRGPARDSGRASAAPARRPRPRTAGD